MITAGTASEVVDAMGNTVAFAEWWGKRCGAEIDPRRVTDWRKRGFPKSTYLSMSKALKARGIKALPSAWNLDTRPTAVTRSQPDEARP